MSIMLDARESTGINEVLIAAIKKDPVKAVEFLVFSGQYSSGTDAQDFVDSVVAKIEHAAVNEALGAYYTEVASTVRELVETFEEPDEKINYLTLTVTYDRSIRATTGESYGWMCSAVKHKLAGEERLSGGTGKKSTSNGNGTKSSSVPCPEGVKSWRKHLEENYPESVPSGSFSAPRILKTLGDPTYLAAAGL